MLTVIDEYTRECLAIVVDRKPKSTDVIETLAELFLTKGLPEHIRSDNGPEFCARAAREWLDRFDVGPLLIEPGVRGRTATARDSTGSFETSYSTGRSSTRWRRQGC